MKEKLLKIIEHYGVNNQQRKLMEEIFELQESITIHELKSSAEYEIPLTELVDTRYHIIEELADCLVILKQFQHYYEITDEQIEGIMNYKIDRQLERIKNENK